MRPCRSRGQRQTLFSEALGFVSARNDGLETVGSRNQLVLGAAARCDRSIPDPLGGLQELDFGDHSRVWISRKLVEALLKQARDSLVFRLVPYVVGLCLNSCLRQG